MLAKATFTSVSHAQKTGVTDSQSFDMQHLLQQLLPEFDIQAGETDMLIMDMPNTPPQQAPIIVAQAKSVQPSTKMLYGTIGVCTVKEKTTSIDPGKTGLLYVSNSAWQLFKFKYPGYEDGSTKALAESGEGPDFQAFDPEGGTVIVVQPPQYGTLTKEPTTSDMYYRPNPGYLGKDKAVFLVNMHGYNIKVVYYINVVSDFHYGSGSYRKTMDAYCPKPPLWQISYNSDNGFASIEPAIQSKLGTESANITVSVSNLANGAVGETTDHAVTFDDTAAGHGWFIDYTPYLNEEYLPTSNPYEWQARPGSAADGKMDMLTVLWHEYGHALGLEHTAAGHDLMSGEIRGQPPITSFM